MLNGPDNTIFSAMISPQPLIKCSTHRRHRMSMFEAHRRIHQPGKGIARESIATLSRDDMPSSNNHLGTYRVVLLQTEIDFSRYWRPERNQNTFSEHDGITLDERNVDLASSPHQPCPSNIVIPGHLSSAARDRIFHLVSKTARNQLKISSFPSPECIEKLIKVGIAKRTETDAWIHPYTFESETSRPVFLTALVAAGCVCFGIPSVNRTGLALQEIVRVALNELVDTLTKTASSYRSCSDISYRPSKTIAQSATSSTSRHLCYGSTLEPSVVIKGRWESQKAVSKASSRYCIHSYIITRY